MNINLNKWFTLRLRLLGGDIAPCKAMNSGWSGSVRTGLLIIMMMFFAGLALDIATLAAALAAFVLADRALYPLLRGQRAQRRAA